MIWFLLFLLGIIGGTFGSLVGLGGGIIIVPTLLFLDNSFDILNEMGPQKIVGTTILVLLTTGLSSTLSYFKQKKVDFMSGMIFFIGSGPGAYVGAVVNKHVDVSLFSLLFGVLMIIISIIMTFKKSMRPIGIMNQGIPHYYIEGSGNVLIYRYSPIVAIICCFFIGMLSGLFGIGGGALMVPLMLLVFGFPVSIAVATSMFMVFLSAISGSIAHITLGNVEWFYAIALVPGAWFGGKCGAWLNNKLKTRTVMVVFRILVVVAGIRLILGSN
ncbi:sulfite exporter TauE/SafE family protein [Virgibacillus byunsanensis]|uniref:Probable membrane transporter protein n=1 Tax=Virgibacillus byunsanensis TaxID=570945 RepID=A0ABW3LI42_9BACI